MRDPTAKINPPRKEKRLPKGLTIEELEMIREACTSLRERALIEVFYSTGCRLSELANMKIADINMQNMSMKVIGKGNKERIVYLSFKALYHLNKYLKKELMIVRAFLSLYASRTEPWVIERYKEKLVK